MDPSGGYNRLYRRLLQKPSKTQYGPNLQPRGTARRPGAGCPVSVRRRRLYDAQTGEVVAELWNGTPPSGYIKGGPDHPSGEAVRAVIERAMADDRKP